MFQAASGVPRKNCVSPVVTIVVGYINSGTISLYNFMPIINLVDQSRADIVFGKLRDAKFTKNQAKILAMLDQVPEVGLSEITVYLGMTSSRASDSLRALLQSGYISSMEVKYVIGRGRTRKIYRLRMPVEDIISDSRRRVAVLITYDSTVDR